MIRQVHARLSQKVAALAFQVIQVAVFLETFESV